MFSQENIDNREQHKKVNISYNTMKQKMFVSIYVIFWACFCIYALLHMDLDIDIYSHACVDFYTHADLHTDMYIGPQLIYNLAFCSFNITSYLLHFTKFLVNIIF